MTRRTYRGSRRCPARGCRHGWSSRSLARALVDDDRVDAGLAEQVRQQESGGAGADDGDSGADGGGHGVSFDGGFTIVATAVTPSRDQMSRINGDAAVPSRSARLLVSRGSPAPARSRGRRRAAPPAPARRGVAGQHDRQCRDHGAGLVAHGHGDARRDALDVAAARPRGRARAPRRACGAAWRHP